MALLSALHLFMSLSLFMTHPDTAVQTTQSPICMLLRLGAPCLAILQHWSVPEDQGALMLSLRTPCRRKETEALSCLASGTMPR